MTYINLEYFSLSERDQFIGSTPETGIDPTLDKSKLGLVPGSKIEKQDVARMHDDLLKGNLRGFWTVPAGECQILAFGSFKIVIVHKGLFPLLIGSVRVRELLGLCLQASTHFSSIPNVSKAGHLRDFATGPGQRAEWVSGPGEPYAWKLLGRTDEARMWGPAPEYPEPAPAYHGPALELRGPCPSQTTPLKGTQAPVESPTARLQRPTTPLRSRWPRLPHGMANQVRMYDSSEECDQGGKAAISPCLRGR